MLVYVFSVTYVYIAEHYIYLGLELLDHSICLCSTLVNAINEWSNVIIKIFPLINSVLFVILALVILCGGAWLCGYICCILLMSKEVDNQFFLPSLLNIYFKFYYFIILLLLSVGLVWGHFLSAWEEKWDHLFLTILLSYNMNLKL